MAPDATGCGRGQLVAYLADGSSGWITQPALDGALGVALWQNLSIRKITGSAGSMDTIRTLGSL